MMKKALHTLALTMSTFLAFSPSARSEDLLRLSGAPLKWGAPELKTGAVVAYAVLSSAYTVPSDHSILSPTNCSAMDDFSNIAETSPGLTEDMVRHELLTALETWERAADIRFVEVKDPRQAGIVIGAEARPEGRAFANLSYQHSRVAKALGEHEVVSMQAASMADASGVATEIEQAYVCLNPKLPWKIGFDGNLKVYDLRYTFTHEIGHAIGLDHPGRTGALMAFGYDERVQDLQSSDVAAARRLYGVARPKWIDPLRRND